MLALLAVPSIVPLLGASPGPPSIAGAPIHGVRCEGMEGSAFHIHQHLAIFDHGRAVPIPSDVGRPLAAQCLYWLHTHTPDGIVHIEAPVTRTFLLGDFFAVWGEPLGKTDVAGAKIKAGEHVAVFVGGRPYSGDPRAIELTQHADIAILVGPPYKAPAAFTDWNGN